MAAPLIESAIARIRELILAGELRPGSRLPAEPELAKQLGTSRNTAREAVRALITARVLDVRRGDGTYVTSLRPELLLEGLGFAIDLVQDDSLLDLVEVRMLLEPAATALAAARIDDAGLAELRACLDAMHEVRDRPEELILRDADFHACVARATGNQALASMLTAVSSRTQRARAWRGQQVPGSSDRTLAEHGAILDAIATRDARLAESVAAVHVATTRDWVASALQKVLDDDAGSRRDTA
ncbi:MULTISPECIES: FadR/GntR family transcriptional regulator [unclassified Nocardioides]|uniref:FadR/GntR family transcriptional regulator n=1 Tax=unclassified Nocardioides TaxID=2615069 RepID=UPI0036090B65